MRVQMTDSSDSLSKPTIRDIARIAGVSVATVSRVINDRPDVSAETRDAVQRLIRTHNFSTNRSARALSVGRTGLIGLTIPYVLGDYFTAILSGATEALHEEDMRAVLCPTLHLHDREVTLMDRLMRGTTDGAILVLPSESTDELLDLQRQGWPFVIVDSRQPLGDDLPAVYAAHLAGARAATDHLLELGHRRIALITGSSGWFATEERINGYQAALFNAGVPVAPELIVQGNFEIESGRSGAHTLLGLDEPPTAIFASNDNMAVGAIQAARERGLRVPEDLSVVGFDDADISRIVTPMLTTVRQPLEEMGRMAVSLLTRLLEQQRVETLRIELATRLVLRESTAPPPSTT